MSSFESYPWGRWIKWVVLGLCVVVIAFSTISTYNGLVNAELKMKTSWSQVENAMQRRLDVLPNLVEVAKKYAAHEEKVFSDIANARSVLMDPTANLESKVQAEERMVRSFNFIVESYPNLKADTQFTNLQTAIEGSENRISQERRNFIQSVEFYNHKVKTFPGSIFAGIMSFTEKDYFAASPEAQNAPQLDFGD